MKNTILFFLISSITSVNTTLPSFDNAKKVDEQEIALCLAKAGVVTFVCGLGPAMFGNVACEKVAAVGFGTAIVSACVADSIRPYLIQQRRAREQYKRDMQCVREIQEMKRR